MHEDRDSDAEAREICAKRHQDRRTQEHGDECPYGNGTPTLHQKQRQVPERTQESQASDPFSGPNFLSIAFWHFLHSLVSILLLAPQNWQLLRSSVLVYTELGSMIVYENSNRRRAVCFARNMMIVDPRSYLPTLVYMLRK
jgi:hypothetical protein